MGAITDARKALADTVTSAAGGRIICEPYPPDALISPAAFIDSLSVSYERGSASSFCHIGQGTATIVMCAQRHDRAASHQLLEDIAPDAVDALADVPGIRVNTVQSGSAEIMGQELPALSIQVTFTIGS